MYTHTLQYKLYLPPGSLQLQPLVHTRGCRSPPGDRPDLHIVGVYAIYKYMQYIQRLSTCTYITLQYLVYVYKLVYNQIDIHVNILVSISHTILLTAYLVVWAHILPRSRSWHRTLCYSHTLYKTAYKVYILRQCIRYIF